MRGAARALAPLALAAALALPAAAGGGEGPAPPAPGEKKLSWRLPEQASREAAGQPWDLALVAGRVCVSVLSPGSSGSRQARFFGRSPEGLWIELSGVGDARRVSRWARLKGGVVALAGGRGGVQAVVVTPEAAKDKKVQVFDVFVPKVKEGVMHFRGRDEVHSLDLAAREGRLYALFSASSRGSTGGQSCRVALCASADGGRTWSKPSVLAESSGGYWSGGACAALWAGKKDLHALYNPPRGRSGKDAGPRHSVSSDGGKTWKDGPALPAPAEGKKLHAARAFGRGGEVYLLATESSRGGHVWLYHSSDGGGKWAKPRAIAPVRAKSYSSLDACHLCAGAGLLVFGQGWQSGSYRKAQKTGGELLSSRDGGATWKKREFTAGLTGQVGFPRAVLGAGGDFHVVFGWSDRKGRAALLYRLASPRPAPGLDEKSRAAIAGLIEKLAHKDYRVRERAAAGLTACGLAVLPALRRAAKDADAERSLTAGHLVGKLTPPWWKGE